MALTSEELKALYTQAKQLRKDIIDTTVWAGGAHLGGGLSITDILTYLYFYKMNVDPANPDWMERDRLILSKGHTAIAYAPALARRGYFDPELLKTFNKFKSPFGMHPDSLKVKGCDASTGSLGHGLPMAVGMALGLRYQMFDSKIYCIVGDGECNEGSNWEALMSASHYNLTKVVPIVDRNRLMIDGPTAEIMNIEPLADKLTAFGMDVKIIDGHDFNAIHEAFTAADQAKEKPVAIIADTIKGKGVDFMENDVRWHYGSIDSELKKKALASIDSMYAGLV